MEITDILRQLERCDGAFPREAVQQAVARKDEITPELLRVLEDSTARAEELAADESYLAPIYAMFLLAQFREVKAYGPVVRFVSLPGGAVDAICGDFITQNLGAVLASVCGGDPAGIQSLIENEQTDQWVRGSAVGSLGTLVATGQRSRDLVLSYFGELFRGKLEREPSQVWNELVSACCDLGPAELLGDIEQAYRDGLVEEEYISMAEVARAGNGRILLGDPDRRLVENTVEEMEWWACFQNKGDRREPERVAQAAVDQARRESPKAGRNDPCPCGSGKKYKKCCGAG